VKVAGVPRVVGSPDGSRIFDLERLSARFLLGPKGFPQSMRDLLEAGLMREPFLSACADAIANEPGADACEHAIDEVVWQAPIERPTKLVCVNSNRPTSKVEQYQPEYGGGWPRAIYFLKAPSAVIGHNEPIRVYTEMNSKIQPEGEPAVVIGRRATRVRAEDALDYVMGLSLLCDISASLFGLQDAVMMKIAGKDGEMESFINRAMARSKGVDTFAPFGPWIVPLADIGDPRSVEMETRIVRPDGVTDVIQKGSIGEQNFPIEEIIETVSRTTTLEVGDVIAMGAMNMAEGHFLRGSDLALVDGGRIELDAPKLGVLSNPIQVSSWAEAVTA
jgi:2-keto-4-pentenoate hydratase/2-oxohepta-3-ene-1,7-dioic acid hydratase in catechol pathway